MLSVQQKYVRRNGLCLIIALHPPQKQERAYNNGIGNVLALRGMLKCVLCGGPYIHDGSQVCFKHLVPHMKID